MAYKLNNNIFNKSPWDDNSDIKDIFNKVRKNRINFDLNNFNFKNSGKLIALVVLAIFGLWLSSGIYEVKEGEEAAVIRFGRFIRKGYAGLNYHLPSPFEEVIIEKVNQSRRIEIGYRSGSQSRAGGEAGKIIEAESTMLTGDENIFVLNCDIMWHIDNLENYIFSIVNPEETVKTAVESAIREIIGKTYISSILSNQKQQITKEIEELSQKILDRYTDGVRTVIIDNVQLLKAEPPTEVIAAYRDVQTSKADKEREINQAESYNNDILPRARGDAAKIMQEAEGYKQAVIARAEGDAQRFTAIYSQYANNKQVTKDRLSLEAIEDILQGANKTIVGADGTLPHLAITPKQ